MSRHRARGFTLIELLVVIAIIAVLIGLLLPAVQAAREAARRAQCVNNFKQMGLALHNYHDTNGSFPIGRMGSGYTYPQVADQRKTWAFSVLPFFEQSNLYNAINFSLPFYDMANTTVIRTPLAMFQCPSDTPSIQEPDTPYPRSKSNFAANWGNTHFWQDETGRGADGPNPWNNGPMGLQGAPNGLTFTGAPFKGNKSTGINEMTDGTSNTILIGEVIMGANAPAVRPTTTGATSSTTTTTAPCSSPTRRPIPRFRTAWGATRPAGRGVASACSATYRPAPAGPPCSTPPGAGIPVASTSCSATARSSS